MGEPSRVLAASVRIPTMLWRVGVERKPPCHQRSYVSWWATPVAPASYNADAICAPTRFIAATSEGSRLGFTGSVNGGTKSRTPFEPIWWTSYTTSGNHSVYSIRVTRRVSACVTMNQSRLLSWPMYLWYSHG